MNYIFMSRSLTQAQRIASLLESSGITATVIKAPSGLSDRGCAYAVKIYRHYSEALMILRRKNLINGKIFMQTEQGEYLEV